MLCYAASESSVGQALSLFAFARMCACRAGHGSAAALEAAGSQPLPSPSASPRRTGSGAVGGSPRAGLAEGQVGDSLCPLEGWEEAQGISTAQYAKRSMLSML